MQQGGQPVLDDRGMSPDWIFHGTVRPPGRFGCSTDDGTLFRRGDVDGNGALEVTDPINNLAFQFLGDYVPICRDALDFDDNGAIEVTDPIANLARQFLGGDPPAPPGADTCGADPTTSVHGRRYSRNSQRTGRPSRRSGPRTRGCRRAGTRDRRDSRSRHSR